MNIHHTEIDDFDRAILRLLQNNSRMSQSDIGAAVNLSTAAVNRRIQRLQNAGIITGYGAIVSPNKVGRPITVITQVEINNEQIDQLDALKAVFERHPAVQQCYYVTGDVDFVLVIVARDMDEYVGITRTLFFGNDNVKRFKTLVVMDRIKVSLKVPLD